MPDPIASVVIPCLNEEKTLPSCIAAARRGIEAAGIPGEVIVVDNGSADRSVAVAEAAGARVVHCERRGYGNALRTGFAAARGRFILMGDADESYDLSELPRFLREIETGHDLVMGTRLKGRIEAGAMPWLNRYLGNPLLSGVLRLLFGVPVSDAHCGLRAFTRDAVTRMDLRTGGMELASEIVIKAGAAGLRISEIPITLHRDARGRAPHLRPFRDGWRHLRYMLMVAPNWLYFLPGLVCAATGALLMVALLPGPRSIAGLTLDVFALLLGMALVLFGVYLVLLGCFVKAFTYSERLGATRVDGFALALHRIKLEHGLVAGAALVVLGLSGDAWLFARWIADDAGGGTALRPAILFTTLAATGLQVFFGAFFLSMLGISRGDYVGGYTVTED